MENITYMPAAGGVMVSPEAGVTVLPLTQQLTEQWELHKNRNSFMDLSFILPVSRTNSIKCSFS